jgi:endonuclease YncB( thermonuclease family)
MIGLTLRRSSKLSRALLSTVATLNVVVISLSRAFADNLSGQASIIDGDTLEIHGTRIRLWGIDAPESSQLCQGDCRAKTVRRDGPAPIVHAD